MMLLNSLISLLAVALPAGAVPLIAEDGLDIFDSYHDFFNTSIGALEKRQGTEGPELRILPLGASIVEGYGSSHGNGFRSYLREQLRFEGFKVNMVGSRRGGNMADNNHEATGGFTVDQVKQASRQSLIYKPNVVVLNAGSNDCARNVDPSSAGARMASLLSDLWAAPGWDRTTIILPTLIMNQDSNMNDCSQRVINSQYRQLVNDLRGQGRRIVLAEMNPRKAIETALREGKLQQPYPTDIKEAQPGCEKVAGDGVYAGAWTQRGSGWDDGVYAHESWREGNRPIIMTATSEYDRDQWRFVRLFSRDKDDLLEWFILPGTERTVGYGVWKNVGNHDRAEFRKINDMSVQDNCIPAGVRFIDINGDGLGDFVCIDPRGNAFASINRFRPGRDAPLWEYMGLWKENFGYAQDRVVLGDVDGDGRADYCILDDGGNIWYWRNGWINDMPDYWQPLGMRFKAQGMGDHRGLRFEDINGDSRDDWLWVSDVGASHVHTNSRSCASGKLGDGLNIAWRASKNKGTGTNSTHIGMASYGSSGLRNRIHFARVYGQPQEFGLLGRQDYVFMEHVRLANGRHQFNMRVWKSIGRGGTKVKADGVKYCNMRKNPGGAEDYVWTWSGGKMILFLSLGKSRISGTKSWWGPVVHPIWTPPFNIDRRDLHLSNWDGDGLCGIIWVDSNNQNKVQVWRNKYEETKRWEWDHYVNPAGQLYCPEQRGLGIHDLPVRFADTTGNGRGDYLCIEKDGRSWGWVHEDDGSWSFVDQFNFTEGKDRANIRFADVNGDKKDDMIWVDNFDGQGWVWYNEGRILAGGSQFTWKKPNEPAYSGYKAGTCTYYVDMDGDGRADQHSILGTLDNTAETSLNLCDGGDAVGNDDQPAQDQNLPVMPGTGPEDQDPICGKAPGTWDQSVWHGSGMSYWTLTRAKHYLDSGWPRAQGVEGVPRIIAQYNVDTKDDAWDWNSGCMRHLPDIQVCWQQGTSPASLVARNLAAFMQNFARTLKDEVSSAYLSLPSLVTAFAPPQGNSTELNSAAWLALTAGFLTSIGAYVPAYGGAVSNFAAGILTTGSGIASASSGEVKDPRFDTLESLATKLTAFNDEVRKANEAYFKCLLATTPPNGNADRSMELANVVAQGLFFQRDIDVPPEGDAFRMLIQAPMTSEMWNAQRIFVRIPEHKLKLHYSGREWCHLATMFQEARSWLNLNDKEFVTNLLQFNLPVCDLGKIPDGPNILWDLHECTIGTSGFWTSVGCGRRVTASSVGATTEKRKETTRNKPRACTFF
ncbi:hypothetical protein B0I35DRAFT_411586 [Stachybotrys elegans]|uniref:SGNH hydrolase-type esterase domain-containing protein n=1 Tax=Stachybotrys elegans TaxID=80388 RepID=A0A8K0WP17_9HYPO|nr:hypothetical protein B0I35DRAFT_411586 [Stachybotrys elegans]